MEILRTQNLVKTYGTGENTFNAVDDVSFSVQQGEFVAIVGASGSGKSTLMHMLGGVDRPTSGSIVINGQDITGMTNDQLAVFRRQQVGIVYQFYNLIPILTAEENVVLPIQLDGRKPDPQRVQYVFDELGITSKMKSLPNEMSGGQQQRVSIARAIINEPAILLADEPTGNLDTKSTEDIVDILQHTNKAFGQTIIMITHNMDIAKRVDRTITIRDGKIVEGV
ncbi:MAG: ABC transporter ATP-binding protein [Clostridia bacterium]|nr:ABC transporter ATP-binding protein [Clostridia bacterium]